MKVLKPLTNRKTFVYDNMYLVYKHVAILRISKKYNPKEYIDVEIDVEDVDKCRRFHWYPHRDKTKPKHLTYIYGGQANSKLHRFLLNPPNDMVIDHIDRNPLNNRRSNLRICTVHENNQNFSMSKNNTSGYIGIRYRPEKDRWLAFRTINLKWTGKTFKTFEEAYNYRKYLETL